MHSFLSIFFLVFVASNMLFYIVVAVWAGVGPQAHLDTTYAVAVAFSVFDFLVNAGMIVFTFIGNRDQGGGFSEPPVTTV